MPDYKIVNGVGVGLTVADTAARLRRQAAWPAHAAKRQRRRDRSSSFKADAELTAFIRFMANATAADIDAYFAKTSLIQDTAMLKSVCKFLAMKLHE